MDGGSALPDLRTRDAIHGFLNGLAMQLGTDLSDPWVAHELDKRDKLADMRSKFLVPKISDLLDDEEKATGQHTTIFCINMHFEGV